MKRMKISCLVALAVGAIVMAPQAASAEDFLSALFGSITGRRPPPQLPNLMTPFDPLLEEEQMQQRPSRGSGQAFCVRSCDGRYFPLAASESAQSRAATCTDLCPASETRVFFGSSITRAYTEAGRAYSDFPNAFRYRNELVKDCTCNGKDVLGLAHIKLESDPTLRRGDFVSTEAGLMVANGTDRRGIVNLSPVSKRRDGERADVNAR